MDEDTIRCKNACKKLQMYGEAFFSSAIIREMNIRYDREEICTGSSMHRGVYNPSPVIERFVGNIKRGHLLKKKTNRTKNYIRFLFYENKLQYVEKYYQGEIVEREYIIYQENLVIGITVGNMGIGLISEEIYEEGTLMSYATVQYWKLGNEYFLSEFRKENYYYDNQKVLARCVRDCFEPTTEIYERYSLSCS